MTEGTDDGREERQEGVGCGESSDRTLVLRMRAGEERAFREFFLRFEPLVSALARRARVEPSLRREVVDDGLARVALQLARPTSVTPDRLAAYVAAAFLGPLRDAARADARRARLLADVSDPGLAGEGGVVSTTCSEASLRASRGTGATHGWEGGGSDAPAHSPAVDRLVSLVCAATSEEERQVLGWLAERVPQRLIAEWTGTKHDAGRKRILRLRARLREAVLRYADSLPADERRAVLRVLGRNGEARIDREDG